MRRVLQEPRSRTPVQCGTRFPLCEPGCVPWRGLESVCVCGGNKEVGAPPSLGRPTARAV